jgi:hypothetical protein
MIKKTPARRAIGSSLSSLVPDVLYAEHLTLDHVISPDLASHRDRFEALARALRDVLTPRWLATEQLYERRRAKRTYYLSMEYLLGRALANNIINMQISQFWASFCRRHSIDPVAILDQEPDPGLGNGGLGRLAACMMESMATLGIPGMGYGLRYREGIFRQILKAGAQLEQPDHWLARPDPWEVPRPEERPVIRKDGLEWLVGDIQYHGPEHLHQPPVRVVNETRIARQRNQAASRVVVEADVEDGIHHPGHREAGAGAAGHQQGSRGIAEPAPRFGLEAAQCRQNLLPQAWREATVLQVREAGRRGHDEARGNRQAEAAHLREVCALATEKILHSGMAFVNGVDPLRPAACSRSRGGTAAGRHRRSSYFRPARKGRERSPRRDSPRPASRLEPQHYSCAKEKWGHPGFPSTENQGCPHSYCQSCLRLPLSFCAAR